MSQTSATQGAAETIGSAQGDLMGLAVLGKTALALGLVIAVIFACSYLLRRLSAGRGRGDRHLKVVTSTAVGQRERVVIVEVEGTWLVLGVGGGQVTRLHDLPAPDEPERDDHAGDEAQGFAARFATALRANARGSLGRRGSRPGHGEDQR
ncbi:flagellar biosynthetic protein FliO [Modicisalibacter radicis]|uniref:flagellar biosynthetic protein FliO n=1 Tax=Halomonas sp. EAR18 TaxID=2518972 RepID=UPI00109CFED2|nr:flagellar biosynthetic protein FliO [Halomonas sp. EAR18]